MIFGIGKGIANKAELHTIQIQVPEDIDSDKSAWGCGLPVSLSFAGTSRWGGTK
jgi:hypothetical protein